MDGEEKSQGSRTRTSGPENEPPGDLGTVLGREGVRGAIVLGLGCTEPPGQPELADLEGFSELVWVGGDLDRRNAFPRFLSDPRTEFVQIKH